jgi:hypothetical protein
MEDLRESELQNIKEVCTLLSNQYPHLLKLEDYEHPVKGVRTSLNIIPRQRIIDLNLVRGLTIKFIEKEIHIVTAYQVYILEDIFKDGTVITL